MIALCHVKRTAKALDDVTHQVLYALEHGRSRNVESEPQENLSKVVRVATNGPQARLYELSLETKKGPW